MILGARVTFEGPRDEAEEAYRAMNEKLDEYVSAMALEVVVQVQREPDLLDPEEDDA